MNHITGINAVDETAGYYTRELFIKNVRTLYSAGKLSIETLKLFIFQKYPTSQMFITQEEFDLITG